MPYDNGWCEDVEIRFEVTLYLSRRRRFEGYRTRLYAYSSVFSDHPQSERLRFLFIYELMAYGCLWLTIMQWSANSNDRYHDDEDGIRDGKGIGAAMLQVIEQASEALEHLIESTSLCFESVLFLIYISHVFLSNYTAVPIFYTSFLLHVHLLQFLIWCPCIPPCTIMLPLVQPAVQLDVVRCSFSGFCFQLSSTACITYNLWFMFMA